MQIESRLTVLPELDRLECLQTRLRAQRFPVHFHDTFVIQLIEKGRDWCCVNNLTAYPGQVFVHFPMASHTGGTWRKEELAYQAIYPTIGLFQRITGVPFSEIAIGRSLASRNPTLVRQVELLFRQIRVPCSKLSKINSRLSNVFHEILREQNTQARRNRNESNEPQLSRKLERARQYLIDHADRDISIAELSSVCCVSQFHLIRSFKLLFGITPRRFLISQRVVMAKQLMTRGLPLAQAALASGFADQSHLNRCFKRVTSLSPGQFQSANEG